MNAKTRAQSIQFEYPVKEWDECVAITSKIALICPASVYIALYEITFALVAVRPPRRLKDFTLRDTKGQH